MQGHQPIRVPCQTRRGLACPKPGTQAAQISVIAELNFLLLQLTALSSLIYVCIFIIYADLSMEL
jgi:hypothetical protein